MLRVAALMNDGSEGGDTDGSLGTEIPDYLNMRSCPRHLNQALPLLPFPYPFAPRFMQGRQLVPQGDAWTKRKAQILTPLLALYFYA